MPKLQSDASVAPEDCSGSLTRPGGNRPARLERDPLNRYHDARELAWDLEHQDQVALGRRHRASNIE